MQEELNNAIAEKDASQEEIANVKLAAERNERQARQEQSRLQAEINSFKMRLERADADLVHARRENIQLREEVAALQKEVFCTLLQTPSASLFIITQRISFQINMSKIIGETRVGVHPPKMDRGGKDDKERDKELASLIYDLESKQGGDTR